MSVARRDACADSASYGSAHAAQLPNGGAPARQFSPPDLMPARRFWRSGRKRPRPRCPRIASITEPASDNADKFAKANCALVGASIDSEFTHFAWTELPRKKARTSHSQGAD